MPSTHFKWMRSFHIDGSLWKQCDSFDLLQLNKTMAYAALARIAYSPPACCCSTVVTTDTRYAHWSHLSSPCANHKALNTVSTERSTPEAPLLSPGNRPRCSAHVSSARCPLQTANQRAGFCGHNPADSALSRFFFFFWMGKVNQQQAKFWLWWESLAFGLAAGGFPVGQ